MSQLTRSISARDRDVLKKLAARVAEAATDPYYSERRKMWKLHNGLLKVKPMVLIFPENSWVEAIPPSKLECASGFARQWESILQRKVYQVEHLRDANVVEPFLKMQASYQNTGWGLEPKHLPNSQQFGAWEFDPVIKKPEGLKLLMARSATRPKSDRRGTRSLVGSLRRHTAHRAVAPGMEPWGRKHGGHSRQASGPGIANARPR